MAVFSRFLVRHLRYPAVAYMVKTVLGLLDITEIYCEVAVMELELIGLF